jgi:hypothetical protein
MKAYGAPPLGEGGIKREVPLPEGDEVVVGVIDGGGEAGGKGMAAKVRAAPRRKRKVERRMCARWGCRCTNRERKFRRRWEESGFQLLVVRVGMRGLGDCGCAPNSRTEAWKMTEKAFLGLCFGSLTCACAWHAHHRPTQRQMPHATNCEVFFSTSCFASINDQPKCYPLEYHKSTNSFSRPSPNFLVRGCQWPMTVPRFSLSPSAAG